MAIGVALVKGVRANLLDLRRLHARHAVAGLAAGGAVGDQPVHRRLDMAGAGRDGGGIRACALARSFPIPDAGPQMEPAACGRASRMADGRWQMAGGGPVRTCRFCCAGSPASAGAARGRAPGGVALVASRCFSPTSTCAKPGPPPLPTSVLSAADKAEDLAPWTLPPRHLQAAALEERGTWAAHGTSSGRRWRSSPRTSPRSRCSGISRRGPAGRDRATPLPARCRAQPARRRTRGVGRRAQRRSSPPDGDRQAALSRTEPDGLEETSG